MKTMYKIAVALILVGFTIAGCKKDNLRVTADILRSGVWRISFFQEDKDNHSDHFSGYQFVFNKNRTASAIKDNITVSGTWSTFVEGGVQKVFFDFGDSGHWDELNEDWLILEQTPDLIRLQHISGGNGKTDYLTFQHI